MRSSSPSSESRSDGASSNLAEGMFEAWTLRREHLATVFSDVPVVFEPNAELARNINPGFVREDMPGASGVAFPRTRYGHSRRRRRLGIGGNSVLAELLRADILRR
jgi:hypothetical protein